MFVVVMYTKVSTDQSISTHQADKAAEGFVPFFVEGGDFGAWVRAAKKRQNVSVGKVINSNSMLERMMKYGLSKGDAQMLLMGLFSYRSYDS